MYGIQATASVQLEQIFWNMLLIDMLVSLGTQDESLRLFRCANVRIIFCFTGFVPYFFEINVVYAYIRRSIIGIFVAWYAFF